MKIFMRKRLLLSLALLSLYAQANASVLLLPGISAANSSSRSLSLDHWLALYPADGAWRLDPARLERVESAHELEFTSQYKNVLVYLRHPALQVGKAQTSNIKFSGTVKFVSAAALKFTFQNHLYRVYSAAGQSFLKRDDQRASIGSEQLQLLWAGDVNGDQLLDIVTLDLAANRGEACLWLSTAADQAVPLQQAGCQRFGEDSPASSSATNQP